MTDSPTLDGNSTTSMCFEDEELGSDWPLYVRIPIGVVVTVIGVINIVGNTCTIISYTRDSKLQTVANLFILNLAVTDLIVGIVSVPFYAVYTVLDFYWPFGYAFCKLWSFVDFWVCAESSLTIILISYDRLSMVTKGAQYQQVTSKRQALVKIAVSWVLSCLLYGPAILAFDVWRGYSTVDEDDCDVEFATDFLFTLITSVLEFLVPFVLITVFNTILYANIRKRSIRVSPHEQSLPGGQADKMIRRDKKAARNLSLLVAVYFLCWLPYVVATSTLAVCDTCVDENLYEFFNWLVWLNSSLNAFMYAATNDRFRQNYKALMCCLCERYKASTRSTDVTTISKKAQEHSRSTETQ